MKVDEDSEETKVRDKAKKTKRETERGEDGIAPVGQLSLVRVTAETRREEGGMCCAVLFVIRDCDLCFCLTHICHAHALSSA